MSYEVIQAHQAIFRVGPSLIEDRLDPLFFQPKYSKFDVAVSKSPFEVIEIGSRNASSLFTHMPGFSKDKWVKYVSEGIPYLLQINVQEGYIEQDGWEYITSLAHANLKTSNLRSGDVLLTATGMHYGKAAVVPDWLPEANACPDILRVVLQNRINPYYVAAFLNSDYGQIELRRHSSGANRPRIITEYARKVRLVLPSRTLQDYIGVKVRLVEYCRKRADELGKRAHDALVETIGFREPQFWVTQSYWIDPDSVTSRLNAEFYQPAYLSNLKRLQEFPNGFVCLGQIIESGSYGVLPSSSEYGMGSLSLIRSTDLHDFTISSSSLVKVPDKYLRRHKAQVRTGEVLLEVKGAVTETSVVPTMPSQAIVNGSIFRFGLKKGYNPYFIALYLKSKYAQFQKEQNAVNSVIFYLDEETINHLILPNIEGSKQDEIGKLLERSILLREHTTKLIHQAKEDVEALMEGRLGEEDIIRQDLNEVIHREHEELINELNLKVSDLIYRKHTGEKER